MRKTNFTSYSKKWLYCGVAIGTILSRFYDCIDPKFRSWYVPNCEQAGFRKGHGCLLQLLILVLLINFAKDNNHELFIGFSI